MMRWVQLTTPVRFLLLHEHHPHCWPQGFALTLNLKTYPHAFPMLQVDTPWRKAVTKVEIEDEYQALNKLDRLEVFQEYIL